MSLLRPGVIKQHKPKPKPLSSRDVCVMKITTVCSCLVEMFTVYVLWLQHAGDIEEAVKWLNEAQSLDTADCDINSKCAKIHAAC